MQPLIWFLLMLFVFGMIIASIRARRLVLPRRRPQYLTMWALFASAILVGAYYHTGSVAIALFVFAFVMITRINALERTGK